MSDRVVLISPEGRITLVYSDDLVDLLDAGKVTIRRASHVEPTTDGRWTANLQPSGGPVLGFFRLRSDALAAEAMWLNERLGSLECPLNPPTMAAKSSA